MNKAEIQIRQASAQDLEAINRLITAAVMTWDLPERVKRLSLPSYFYHELDLQHYLIRLAEADGKPAGVVVLENKPMSLHGKDNAMLIHGIFVQPGLQQQGIGKCLMQDAGHTACGHSASGLLVKAQKDAEGFFIRMGMIKLAVENETRDYASRYWKNITC